MMIIFFAIPLKSSLTSFNPLIFQANFRAAFPQFNSLMGFSSVNVVTIFRLYKHTRKLFNASIILLQLNSDG